MELDKKLEAINALQSQDYKKAINICEQIIKSDKESSEIYNIYGLALQRNRLIVASKEKFKKSIELNPNNFEALNNYALSLKYTSDLDLAEEMYLKALKIKPNHIQAMVNLGELKFTKREYEEAIKLYKNGLELLDPSDNKKIYLQNKLVRVYSVIGKFNEARSYAEKILNKDKNNLPAIKALSELTDHNKDKSVLFMIEKIINNPNLTKRGSAFISFELGNIYEKIKDYKRAYYHFNNANKIKNELIKSSLEDINQTKKSLFNIFKNLKFSEFKKNSEEKKVIFVIGIPRSGTTLVEQIISSHREVLATGESQILKSEIHKLFYVEDDGTNKKNKFNNNLFSQEKCSNINTLQKKYFENLTKKNLKSKIYTDKSIENYLYIGFIKIFFPNSKIIITKRDKKDVFLSIFKNDFQSPFMNWSYDKKEILEYFDIYSEMISFWKDLIPDDLYTIEYENLLEDPELEIKKLIKFCDLSWDPMCLQHEKNTSGIETASVIQARKSIYKTSKKMFNNYSEFFSDIFPL